MTEEIKTPTLGEIYKRLVSIPVDKYVDTIKETGIKYISWSIAWQVLKSEFPESYFEVRYFDGLPYLETPLGMVVEVTLIVCGHKQAVMLPVMDSGFNPMKTEAYTIKYSSGKTRNVAPADMRRVTDTHMRCLAKAIAIFGFGITMWDKSDRNYFLDNEEVIVPVAPAKKAAHQKISDSVEEELKEMRIVGTQALPDDVLIKFLNICFTKAEFLNRVESMFGKFAVTEEQFSQLCKVTIFYED